MLDMNPPKVDLDSKTKIPQRYLPKHLTKKDRSVVRKNLIQSRKLYKKNKYFVRPKVKSFKSKKSNHLNRLKNIYGVKNALPSKELSEKTKCSLDALQQIVKKGEGAYLSSGSRPNQTPHSWGIARLASALTGGNASVVDYHVLEEGCKPDSKALKLAKKQCKKIGRKCGNNKTKIKKNKKNKTLKMKGGDEDLPECSICFDTILPSQTFSCGNTRIAHIFHIDCARNYCIARQRRRLGYTFECPICRDTTRTCPPVHVTPAAVAPGAIVLERPNTGVEGPPSIPPPPTDTNIYFHAHSAVDIDRDYILNHFLEYDQANAVIAFIPSDDNTRSYFDLLSNERHGNRNPFRFYNGGEEYTDAEVDEILNNIGERRILTGGNEYTTYVDAHTHYYLATNRQDDFEFVRNIWAIYGPGGVIENYGGQPLLRSRRDVNTNPPENRYYQDDVDIFEEPEDY